MDDVGCDDDPEDISGAIDPCPILSWQGMKKMAILIGDGPCHGKKYNDCRDDYPDGTPDLSECEELVRQMAEQQIDFHVFGLRLSTMREMDRIIEEVYSRSGGYFICNLNELKWEDHRNFYMLVTESISKSIHNSAACGRCAPSATSRMIWAPKGRGRMLPVVK